MRAHPKTFPYIMRPYVFSHTHFETYLYPEAILKLCFVFFLQSYYFVRNFVFFFVMLCWNSFIDRLLLLVRINTKNVVAIFHFSVKIRILYVIFWIRIYYFFFSSQRVNNLNLKQKFWFGGKKLLIINEVDTSYFSCL